jgi:predicted HTH transcriptional regulator
MSSIEILDIIGAGETSKVQFKREFDNQDKIAAEMIAFSNSKGGMLLFGVEDKSGKIIGLNFKEIQVIGNKLVTIANELVKPLIYITTEVVIVSPGCLPDSLTVESIKLGNAAVRNNLITSFCSKLMSYRGFGSGIIRAVESQPNIEMENDEKGEQFIIRVFRDENLASSKKNVATSSENLASSSDNLDSSEGNIGSSSANNIASLDENIGSSKKNKNKKRLSKQEFEKSLLSICASYTSLEELANKLDRNIDYLKNFIIPVLLKDGKLERLYPDTPNHPKQKYRLKN